MTRQRLCSFHRDHTFDLASCGNKIIVISHALWHLLHFSSSYTPGVCSYQIMPDFMHTFIPKNMMKMYLPVVLTVYSKLMK